MQILALAEPPKNLLIYHARLKPGSHTAYNEIEQDIARDCAELGFPHPYLGIEPLSGPEEVWFLSGWRAEAELKQGVNSRIRDVLDLMQLDEIIPIFDDEQTALAALNNPDLRYRQAATQN